MQLAAYNWKRIFAGQKPMRKGEAENNLNLFLFPLNRPLMQIVTRCLLRPRPPVSTLGLFELFLLSGIMGCA